MPPSDHVARYCSGGKLEDGKPTTKAFGEDDEISVNHLEYFPVEMAEAFESFRRFMYEDGPLTVRTSGRYALFEIAEIQDALVYTDPQRGDPSHALIISNDPNEDQIRKLKTALVFAYQCLCPALPPPN